MADADIGRLKATVELDPTKLEQGVTQAEKSLGKLDTAFVKTQQNISGAIRNLSGSISKNSEQIHRSTTYIKDSITNQTRTISSKLDKLNNDINKSNRNFAKSTQQTNKLILQELKHLGKQFELLYTFSQKDYTKGFKRLEQAIRQTASQSTGSLRKIQQQADSTYISLGKLSKVNAPNVKGAINLGVNTLGNSANVSAGIKQATVNADGLYASLTKTWHTLSNISFQVYLFQQGLQQVSNLVDTFVAPGMEFAKSMETNEIGMAGILSSMTTLNDKELEWNQALSISKQIIKELNIEAVRTAATSEELIGTYRALLAPALGAGFKPEEIKEFTVVGVNAVKSMGLEGRQLIQELRDLVQGGIQAASSTLATSLGLTDADIKKAKESSEGLFRFLMERLKGFKNSAEATAQTVKGLEAIVGEGYVLASAEGFKPIIDEYKKVLQEIANAMFDDNSFSVNPKFVEAFREASEYAVKLFRNIRSIIEALSPIGELALNILVPSFKLLAEYADIIAGAFLAYGASKKFGNTSQQAPVAISAQVDNSAIAQASKDYDNLRNSALTAGRAIVDSVNETRAAINQKKDTIANANAVEAKGNKQLANSIRGLYMYYRDLGFSASEARQLQNEASKVAIQGGEKLYNNIVKLTTARANEVRQARENLLTLQAEALKREELARKVGVLATSMQSLGASFTSAGALVKMFAGEENELANEMADIAIQAGTVAYTFGTLIQSIPTLSEGISKLVDKLKALQGGLIAIQMASALAKGGAIGLAVGMATSKIYQATHNISEEEASSRYWDNAQERQKYKDAEAKKEAERKAQAEIDALRAMKGDNKFNLQDNLKAKEQQSKDKEISNSLLRSKYKALEQQLKTALEPLKELQREYDHYYKYDVMATQTYIDEKYRLQQLAIQREIENLNGRKKIAQEANQEDDVKNFEAQIARLEERSKTLQKEKARDLIDEYKKLDDRLAGIRGKYESLVGVSDRAFKTNLVREYADEIVRISAELKVASDKVIECTDTNNTEELKLWETRKQSNTEALKQLTEIISLKKMERDATEALANAERINLEIREKSLAIQSQANNMSISPLNAESQMYEMKKERLDEYIDHYTTAIARYEAMSEKAFNEGDISTSNKFKQMAIEAREALYELMDSLHPLEKAIKEQFIGSLSDMFQSMLWQEKTAKEALKDFAKSIMQTFTKQVFDNFASQISAKIFTGVMPKQQIEQQIQSKITVDLTAFNQSVTQGAHTFQEGILASTVRLNEFNQSIYNASIALSNMANSSGGSSAGDNKWGQAANIAFALSGATSAEGGTNSYAQIGSILNGFKSSYGINYGGSSAVEDTDENMYKFSSSLVDGTMDFKALSNSIKATSGATDDNTGATMDNVLAIGTMVGSLLSASGSLGKFGTILQGLMTAMSIAKATGILGFKADGGYISGPGTGTSDSIPTMLSNGEYVLRAGAVRQLGVGFLDQLNNIDRNSSSVRRSAKLPRFGYAEGGLVNAKVQENKSSTQPVDGNTKGSSPTVVMQMTFQSLDPEANMKLMEAQYPQIRSRLIRDLQNNSSVRTAVKGATK